MKELKIKELSREAFNVYGFYANLVEHNKGSRGFFPDLVQLDMGGAGASCGVCRVFKLEEKFVSGGEYHSKTGEGILPIDGDILIHVAPSSRPAAGLSPDAVEIFRIPMGTMVCLRPGVWHGSPFAFNADCVNVMVTLPQRTFANDSAHSRFEEADRLIVTDEFE